MSLSCVCRYSDKFEALGCSFPKFEGVSERSLVNVLEDNLKFGGKNPQKQAKVDKPKRRNSDTSDLEENPDDQHSDNGTRDGDKKQKGRHKHSHHKAKNRANENVVSNRCCAETSIAGMSVSEFKSFKTKFNLKLKLNSIIFSCPMINIIGVKLPLIIAIRRPLDPLIFL
jgi:hypothetical protein